MTNVFKAMHNENHVMNMNALLKGIVKTRTNSSAKIQSIELKKFFFVSNPSTKQS